MQTAPEFLTESELEFDRLHEAANRSLDALLQEAEREFLSAALEGDMNAPARFAPLRRDYKSRFPDAKRTQTVSEVLLDSLDYEGGPQHDDLFILLAKAAKGQPVQADAKALLGRMSAKWADMYVMEDE